MATTETLVFNKIIYQAGDFAIYAIGGDGPHAGKAAIGKVPMSPDGYLKTDVNVTGEWKEGKYGPQFAFTEISIPNENKVVHFLTHVVRHIPEAVAKRINEKFGNEIWKILDDEPKKLLDIKGIGEKKLEKIIKRWKDVKDIFHLANLLSPIGVTINKIYAIAKYYESMSMAIIQENPYNLTRVPGIGFKLADKIAIGLGMDLNDPRRVQAAVEFCIIERSEMNGDTVFLPSDISEFVREQLGNVGNQQDCMQAIETLMLEEKLLFVHPVDDEHLEYSERIKNDHLITSRQYYKYESDIVKVATKKFFHGRIVEDIEGWITKYEAKHHIKLGEQQKEAVRLINERPSMMALVGYAGTGKTTTSKAMLELLKEHYGASGIVSCALSGIASNRIQQKSGFPAGTIHSTFGYRGPGGWEYNKHNKLVADVLVVDESSMNNSEIFSRIFEAVDTDKTMIILIGDTAQINSIGAAQPFVDLVDNDIIEKVELTEIYRQGPGSGLVMIANQVRTQKMPKEIEDNFDDFVFRKAMTNNHILERIKEWSGEHGQTYINRLKKGMFMEAIGTFQIISPMKKETIDLTSGKLNPIIQDIVNPNPSARLLVMPQQKFPDGNVLPALEYRVGDKVVHVVNENKETFHMKDTKAILKEDDNVDTVERRVMNGQVGVVIDANDKSMVVNYPIENYAVEYTKEEAMATLNLGYAITIHKSQGSEYEKVMMPVSDSHARMLNSKLFYTAMTRASKNFECVGSPVALRKACTKDGGSRHTLISQWSNAIDLRQEKEKEKAKVLKL